MATPEDLVKDNHPKSLINLLRGWPSTSLLPIELLKKAAKDVLSDTSISYPGLLYGPDAGHPRLREALSIWLTKFYGPPKPIKSERIAITGGASQNLGSLLQVFTDAIYTRHVWLVAPAYMLAFRIFEDAGFGGKMRAVPEDEDGIDIAFLRRALRKSEEKARLDGNDKPTVKPPKPWRKIYRHVIYAVPTFANPSSRTMSLKRREELVRLAREYDALVITDDVYDLLQWPASTETQQSSLEKALLPRLVDVDRFLDDGAEREGSDGFGNVVSNGSFSKVSAPGLRTGWVEGTKKFAYGVSQTGTTASGGAPSQFSSTYIADLLESGDLQRHIHGTLQPAYASRYRTMISAVQQHLVPLGVQLPQSDRDVVGGYFIWILLPQQLRGAEVARRAKEDENLVVAQGELFEVPGDTGTASFPHGIRLCFAWETEDNLREGVERLASVVRTIQQSGGSNGAQHGTANGQSRKEGVGESK